MAPSEKMITYASEQVTSGANVSDLAYISFMYAAGTLLVIVFIAALIWVAHYLYDKWRENKNTKE